MALGAKKKPVPHRAGTLHRAELSDRSEPAIGGEVSQILEVWSQETMETETFGEAGSEEGVGGWRGVAWRRLWRFALLIAETAADGYHEPRRTAWA